MINFLKKPFYIIFAFLTLGLTIANITTSASLSTYGQKIKDAEQEKTRLAEENHKLEQKILDKSSLTYLEEKAATYGFVKPDQIIAISTPAPIALSH